MKRNKLIEFDSLYERSFKNYYFVGIDEVGRGALAGPVIACAFTWKRKIRLKKNKNTLALLSTLNDSKQLTRLEREDLYPLLVELGDYGLGYASVQEINKLNILNATFLAMKRAYEKVLMNSNGMNLEPYLLIDGNKFNPYINSQQSFIIDGDAKSAVIAGASIIAKVYRDMLMHRVSKLDTYKKYGWSRNVGYGTLSHRNAIRKYGVTALHRKLFVRRTLAQVSFCE